MERSRSVEGYDFCVGMMGMNFYMGNEQSVFCLGVQSRYLKRAASFEQFRYPAGCDMTQLRDRQELNQDYEVDLGFSHRAFARKMKAEDTPERDQSGHIAS